MSNPAARARLALTALDDRLVPSTVTSTATARPFDFVATGTLTTTAPTAAGTTTTTNTVALTGQLAYTDPTTGATGSVTLNGSGNGSTAPAAAAPTGPADPTGPGADPFAQIVQAQFAFKDDNGAVAVTTPLSGSASWQTATKNGNQAFGPFSGTGAFDTATDQLSANLTAAGGAAGTLAVTLTGTTTQVTDLSFSSAAAARAADGTVSVDFTADATGKLMTAANHGVAAHVTGYWSDGQGRTEATDFDVPLYWNTGAVTASVRGLTAPTWATTFTLALDQANAVAEADETNNTWTATLAALSTDPLPSDAGGGTDTGTSPPPASPPPPPASPPPGMLAAPAGYSVTPIGNITTLQWRSETGMVTHSQVVFDGFSGDASVAVGDVNGDGVLDAAVAAGTGGGPRVRVFDGATGAVLSDRLVFEDSFRGGVNVALGDLDGDGKADLVVGAGEGGGPRVRVFDGATGALRNDFMAYDPSARGGVSVAAADLNGDGKTELITGAGVGGEPVIALFNGADGTELQRVLAGAVDDRGGAKVSVMKDKDGHFVVSADSETTGALKRFRQQLAAATPELTEIPADEAVVPSQVNILTGMQTG